MEKAIKKELQELERIKKRIGEGNSPSDSSLVCRKIRGRYRYYIDRQIGRASCRERVCRMV